MSAATVAVGVVAAGATVYGAVSASNAASDATNAQVAAGDRAAQASLTGTRESIAAQREMTDKAAAVMREQYNQSRQDLAPFRQAQLAALQQAQGLTDINNPFYQQQRETGSTMIQRKLASQGLLRSKKQVDLLTNLELGLNEQRAAQVNSLANIGAVQTSAGLSQAYGQNMAGLYGGLGGGIGAAYQNSGNSLANIYAGQGGAIAQGAIAQGQITGQLIGGLNSAFQTSVSNYQYQQQLAEQRARNQQAQQPTGNWGGGKIGYSPYA